MTFQLAQVNIAAMVAPLDSPVMAGFVARIPEINAVAESSEGFVWRYTGPENPFDSVTLFNLSVWESPEALKQFTYRSTHKELFAGRAEWFQKPTAPTFAMWWIEAGKFPEPAEARHRLEHLQVHGDTEFAFTYRGLFGRPTDEQAGAAAC